MKKPTVKSLKKKADEKFSIYIRRKNADWRGYSSCYTCGKVAPWKELQCGHFVSRASTNLRFDETNARVQCCGCNVFKSGNYVEYAGNLIKEKGAKEINRLRNKGKHLKQWTIPELEAVIKKYEKKIKQLDR